MGWTDERVELLKKRWAEGQSASQIAAELGGVTRNAVIGKVHRLGLSGRAKAAPSSVSRMRPKPSTAVAQQQRRPQATAPRTASSSYGVQGNAALAMSHAPAPRPTPAPRVMPVEVIESAPLTCERVTIMELKENMCRWPLGDPSQPEFRFCGGRSTPGAAYCPHHSQIAYQPVNDRRRDRRISVPH